MIRAAMCEGMARAIISGKKKPTQGRLIKTGRGREIRTPDILLPKQARYQTALYPETILRIVIKKTTKYS